MKNKIYSLLILLIYIYPALGNNIDSLEVELKKANKSEKTKILIQLSKANWTIAPSKGILYANEAIEYANLNQDTISKARALLYGGVNAWFIGAYNDAIEYYHKSLKIARKNNYKRLCAYNLNNLGMLNTYLKNYEKAIENYTESSIIIKNLGDEIGSLQNSGGLSINFSKSE